MDRAGRDGSPDRPVLRRTAGVEPAARTASESHLRRGEDGPPSAGPCRVEEGRVLDVEQVVDLQRDLHLLAVLVCREQVDQVVGYAALHRDAARAGRHCAASWLARSGVMGLKIWWSQAGSNRRPLACHASALPAELWPRLSPREQADRGLSAGCSSGLAAQGARVLHISFRASSASGEVFHTPLQPSSRRPLLPSASGQSCFCRFPATSS